MRFRNENLFVKIGVTVNLSQGQPKINGISQLRLQLLLNMFDEKTLSQIFFKCICSFVTQLKLHVE